jgi:hypothetical protein
MKNLNIFILFSNVILYDKKHDIVFNLTIDDLKELGLIKNVEEDKDE